MRSRDRHPVFDESMDVEFNRLMHHLHGIFPGCSCCDTTRKTREILDIIGITIKETGEPGKGARFEMVVPKGAWRMNVDTDLGKMSLT